MIATRSAREIPFLFEGRLPDFNIGTNNGDHLRAAIEAGSDRTPVRAAGYSTVLNGRFKGGWTTRHYGRPGKNVHAIQMELAQRTYLAAEAPPWPMTPDKAEPAAGGISSQF
jgi:N-formylglutamate deformylase